MNLDRLCILFIFSLLPILWLPQNGLWLGITWAVILLLFALKQRQWLLLICALLIGVSFGRVGIFAENLQNQTAYTSRETIQIQRILKQGEKPTAIAIRENGELIQLHWQSETALKLGQRYQAELRLRPIFARLNDGNFNRQRWLIAQHISATAFVKDAEILGEQRSLRAKWLERSLNQTENQATQGLILALAFGERAWLKTEDWALFRNTATAHLIAISGLHIALAAGLGFWFANLCCFGLGYFCHRFGLPQAVKNPHFFAIFIGLLTAWGYSFLAGFAIPTVRAAIAVSLVLACRFARRYYTPWQFWLRCVVSLIALDPLSLLSDSFWLSTLAVASLIFWHRYFPLANFPTLHAWQQKNAVLKFAIGLLHLQTGIALCFLPVQLYFFAGFSPWAFLANLWIVPLYSLVVVPLILLSLLTDNFFHSWDLVAKLLEVSLIGLEPLSYAWQTLSLKQQWQMVCTVLFLLGILYWRTQLKSVLSALVVGVLSIYQLGIWAVNFGEKNIAEWLVFDVGQGLATAFIYSDDRGRKNAVLYDTGSSWQGGSMAELEILPYLQRHDISLNAIFVSHDDNDHSGGVQPLLRHYPTATVISPSQMRYSENQQPCLAGQEWQFGEMRFTAVFPLQTVPRANNAHSCVILAQIGQFKLLLTGDSGTNEERIFAPKIGKIDLLQVGHHGSKTSTGYTLLANTQPKQAIISTGRFNLWKLPNKSILQRLDEQDIAHFDTAKTGMIKVKFYADRYEISPQRNAWTAWYSGYWGK